MEAWPGSVIEDDLARKSEAVPGMAGTEPTCIGDAYLSIASCLAAYVQVKSITRGQAGCVARVDTPSVQGRHRSIVFLCLFPLSLSLSLSLPQVDRFGTYIYSHQATVAIVLRKSDFQCRTYNTDSSRHKPHAISCQSKSLLSQVCS